MTEPSVASKRQSWRTALGQYVGGRASALQDRYLAGDPVARGHLAQLRQCVSRPAGADPETWEVVFRGFPEKLIGLRDEPNAAEIAAHSALTLFAVHMQSSLRPMHLPGIGVGTAVRRLALPQDAETHSAPIIRRFHALGTSATLAETLHHARGLVQQLRVAQIGLDYGRLAEDLNGLQWPDRADAVRLRWARDLYRVEKTTDTILQEQELQK